MKKRLILMAAMVALLRIGSVWAEVQVTLDDFEGFAASPWGAAGGADLKPVAEAHGGKAALAVTLRKSGEKLGLLKPIDVPQTMTAMSLWVKGAPGCRLVLTPAFQDRQGFTWFAGGAGVDFDGWKELSFNVAPDKLQPDWRLGWWKQNNKDPNFKFEQTKPLRFVGFKIDGPGDAKPTRVSLDDLAVKASEDAYVALPHSVVLVPQKGEFPIVVAAGAQPVKGDVVIQAISRNDVALEAPPVSVAVNVAVGATQSVTKDIQFSRPGIYKLQITVPGRPDKIEAKVCAVSAQTGVAGFQAAGQKVSAQKLFTPAADIKLSPKQTHRKAWLQEPTSGMQMYLSELSPAWLFVNAGNTYTLFAAMQQWGLGAPSFMAIHTASGPKVFKAGETIPPTVLAQMDRSWVLAWFAGSEGFVDWDAPYLVVLQHKPTKLALDAKNGMSISFAGKAGYMSLLPLYGGYKPPQAGKLQFVNAGLAPKDVLPSQWAAALPAEVAQRCDWWAKVMKAYPVDCDEQFSVDLATDDLVVKSTFEYVTIKDDWNTEPIKFAPIPYVLGTCVWGKTFPVKFDGEVYDPMYPSCYGPYMGVQNADGYTYRMHVLQYVNEVWDIRPPAGQNPSPAAQAAASAMETYLSDSNLWFDLNNHKDGNLCWSIWTDQRWQNSDLAYVNDAGLKLATQLSKQHFFANQLFYRGQYDEADVGVNRKFLFFSGPGFGFQGDAGKITMDTYYTAWLYAYNSGDYQLIADRWEPVISRLNCLPFTMCWARVGRDAIAEGGDEAPPPMGMARLAYAIGDMDSYAYGCYMFARELTHAYVKVGVGADYFRAFQPINPLVNQDWTGSDKWPKAGPIPQRANITNMFGESAGWILGGPPDDKGMYSPEVWDAKAVGRDQVRKKLPDVIPWSYFGSGQWVQKWSRFDAEDVFRFYHDNAIEACRKEFDTWQKVEFPGLPKRYNLVENGKQDGYPSTPWRLMQLRADILGEKDEQIAKLFPPDNWGQPEQTFYQAIVRAASPSATLRLIPKSDKATPFQPGIQRDFVGNPSWDNPVQTPAGIVSEKAGDRNVHWPAPTYYFARPPRVPGGTVGTGDRWSFGYVMPGAAAKPADAKKEPINWVTDLYTFE